MNDPNKDIKFSVYDAENDEIIEMTMDEDDYNAMVEFENQLEFKKHERRQRLRRDDD